MSQPSAVIPRPTVPTSTPIDGAVIPDGIYRTAISASAVTAAGDSNSSGWSGTWTLTIKDGTYALTCRPLDRPGRDCGNSVFDGALEAGHLRGAGDQVWFEHDTQLLSALSGCELPPSHTDPGHCVPLDPYSATWTFARRPADLQRLRCPDTWSSSPGGASAS